MAEGKNGGFITPQVVEEADQDQDKKIVLASQVLPDRIFLMPLTEKPIFPGLMFPMVFSAGTQAEMIQEVAEHVPERVLGVVLTKEKADEAEDEEGLMQRQLYRIGTAVRILRMQETADGTIQALLQGQKRFQIQKATERGGKLMAQVIYLEDIFTDSDEIKALGLSIMNTMRELIQHNPLFSEEIKMLLTRTDMGEPGRLADFAVSMTSSTRAELQEVLEALDVKNRMEAVLFLLRKELDINQLKERITHQIEEKINKQQREFFLREQLKAIKQELGLEKDDKTEEIEKYRAALETLVLPDEARKRIDEEIEKLQILVPQSPEFSVSRNYLDWLTALPWGIYSEDHLDVARARRILNCDHHGLEDVKSRILEFVAVAKLKGSVEGSILCLLGPPGVGKTSLGKAIAEALGRKFFRFSLGGMRDEAEIKGHRRTYIGALPGKVMQAMRNVGTANPVIMLDEIDKIGASFQGDPASALLEVLDPEQNYAFRDHYLDVPFDLSKVLFVATGNVPDTIPGPLMDRMEIIRLSGYIMSEKVAIARKHLVPRLLPRNGLTTADLRFTPAALRSLVDGYAREAGVRGLEKAIGTCLRRIATESAETAEGEGSSEQVVVNPQKVLELLGPPKFTDELLMKRPSSGVAVGMAWTPLGGTIIYIEALGVAGEKGYKLTGQLGDVMVESSHIAYSLIASNPRKFGIDKEFFNDKTVHLHVPAGATKKDGPSAGITMATSLISLALDLKPKQRLAMTGELTLTGRVLPVGGIKEKIIAAKRSKIKEIILPSENQNDFNEIPEKVRKGLTPHFVNDFQQVFETAFNFKPKKS